MKIILLCAGYATRLKPLTDHCPKPLLPLADIPMINHLINRVLSSAERSAIMVVSNAKFFEQFRIWQKKDYPSQNIRILNDGTTSNDNRLGAIQDIAFALKEENVLEDCLVLAGDNYFDFDLSAFLKKAESHRPAATLAVYDVKDCNLATKYGLVTVDAAHKITKFWEKPKEPPTTLASTGVYFFPKESLHLVSEYLAGHSNADAPGHYIEWLVNNSQVFAFPFDGVWYDIGDFQSYEKANQELRHKIPGRG